MNRTLDARLKRIEGEIGTTGDATAAYLEMLLAIRAALQAMVDDPAAPAAEREDARAKLAALGALEWARRHGDVQRFSIIDAIREIRAHDCWFCRCIDEGDHDPDWQSVARELGLSVPQMECVRVRLLTRVIISPDRNPIIAAAIAQDEARRAGRGSDARN